MAIETKRTIKITCDTCGEVFDKPKIKKLTRYNFLLNAYSIEIPCIPDGWYFLNSIRVEIGTKNNKKTDLKISDCNDPHFCCEKCLIEFLVKKLKETVKGKKIKQ